MNVEFPITAENFCEVQCQLIGLPVEGRWREIIDMIIPTINEAYEMGKRGQNAHLDAEDIAALITSPRDTVREFGEMLRNWCVFANKVGRSGVERGGVIVI